MMRSHCESQFPWPTALLQRRAIVDIVTPTTRATALACCCGHCPALLPCRLRPCRRRIAPRRCTSSRPRPLGQRSHLAISSSSLHAPCRRRFRPWPCPGHRRLRPPAICHFSGLAVIVPTPPSPCRSPLRHPLHRRFHPHSSPARRFAPTGGKPTPFRALPRPLFAPASGYILLMLIYARSLPHSPDCQHLRQRLRIFANAVAWSTQHQPTLTASWLKTAIYANVDGLLPVHDPPPLWYLAFLMLFQ